MAKGLSGGVVAVYPPRISTFRAEDNVIVGNVALYGAVRGECFIRGIAAERFCVRNRWAAGALCGAEDSGRLAAIMIFKYACIRCGSTCGRVGGAYEGLC